LVANGKHRKSRIFRLEQEEGLIQGEKELREYITKYYKELFSPLKSIPMSLDESRCDDIPQVSIQENEMLVAQF
jgi:hypothetical protein